jgi:hypothetical protein
MKKVLLLLAVLLVSFQLNAQWVNQTSGLAGTVSLNTVSAIDNNICWIGAAGGVVLRTTNAGTTWASVGGGAIGVNDVYNITAWDVNNCLVTTAPGATFIYRTTNGGTTWTQVFTQASPGFIDAMVYTSATNVFVYGDPVGSRWTLFKSNDGGATFDSTGLFLPQVSGEAGWNNAMFTSGSNLYFGTNKTKIYYSSNSGASWTPQATTGLVNSYFTYFNGGIGWTGSTVCLKSTNGGTNWSAFTFPGAGTIYGIVGSPSQWWAIRGLNVYGSTDGLTFAVNSTPATTGALQAISQARNGNAIWAVTNANEIKFLAGSAVPVELTSFTASANNGTVKLIWNTATEVNNKGFEVQRKSSGSDFVTVAFVNGNGSTTETKNYSYTEKIQSGIYSYRLKQVDYDGHSKLSKEVEVDVATPLTFSLNQNYPNPFNPATSISYSIAKSGLVKIAIYNTLGQQVKELVNEVKEAGSYNVSFNASSLTSGIYFYKIESAQFSQTKKMILMK